MRSPGTRPTLPAYVHHVLGEGGPAKLLGSMFMRSFTAPSFREFWHYWNPVYGYALAYFLYRPLRSAMPAGAALVITFALSGLVLHDALLWPASLALHLRPPFPVVMVAFSVCAFMVLLCERSNISFSRLSPWQRCIAHAACLLFAFGASICIAIAVHAPAA